MPSFIQAHSQFGIFAFVTLTILTGSAVLVVIARIIVSRFPQIRLDLMLPVLLSIVPILSLLLAFLAARLWDNFDRLSNSISKEVTELHQLSTASLYLPAPVKNEVLGGIKTYIAFVLEHDWKQNLPQGNKDFSPVPGLEQIRRALVFEPQTESARMAQNLGISHFLETIAARDYRIHSANFTVQPVVWWTIGSLGVLTIFLIALAHSASWPLSFAGVTLYALSLSFLFSMLISFDYPLEGEIAISKSSFENLLQYINSVISSP